MQIDKRILLTNIFKYTVNPTIKLMAIVGLLPPKFAILETIGRKSGEPRQVPVGNGLVGGAFWLVSEHGENSNYVRNIITNPRVRLKAGHRWYSGTAYLMPDDDPIERIDKIGLKVNGRAVKILGTQLLTIKIELDIP